MRPIVGHALSQARRDSSRRTVFLVALILPHVSLPAEVDDPVAVIQKSAADWNRGDIEAFVQCYEQSPETTFVGATVSHGAENILARYRRSYPDRAHMGRLTFSELQPRPLTPALAIVTGRFTLERTQEGGGRSTGLFTLVLRRGDGGWHIIHDHTSSGS
jgi:uncharacterized protein (TIGR02246 family)